MLLGNKQGRAEHPQRLLGLLAAGMQQPHNHSLQPSAPNTSTLLTMPNLAESQRVNLAATSGCYPDVYMFEQLDRTTPSLSPVLAQREAAPVVGTSQPPRQLGRGRRGSADSYASKHLAAEQRRRGRINERLERLRTIVPHAEKANIATFLEQAYAYIEHLNADVAQLTNKLAERDDKVKELLQKEQEARYLEMKMIGDSGGELSPVKDASPQSHHAGVEHLLPDHEVCLNSLMDDVVGELERSEDKAMNIPMQPGPDQPGH